MLVGLGTGSMALAFAATVANRWFVARRGLVTGILTAGERDRPAVFLPLLAWITEHHGWRPRRCRSWPSRPWPSCPLVWLLLRDHPADVGLAAYGADGVRAQAAAASAGAAGRALRALRDGRAHRTFWLLAGELRDLRRRPPTAWSARTSSRPPTTTGCRSRRPRPARASSASSTSRHGRLRLAHRPLSTRASCSPCYYGLRGLSLLVLPMLLADSVQPAMVLFIVFYGLDWVATVPPTVALCREHFGRGRPIVFGWVFAAHQSARPGRLSRGCRA